MSGYIARNPLMTDEPQFGPPPVVAGRPVLPNPLAMPAGDWRDTIAPQPTQADAADATAKAYSDWLARDRAEQVRLGHVDPATGQLTPEGWRAQAQVIGGGFGPADIGAFGIGAIKNYHGSPHLFPPTPKNPLGEFDLAKIGTGEGNQAFGRGMYTADLEGTSRQYLPNQPTPISPEFKAALNAEDYLGFDTASQAIAAIRAHPDWAKRWDVENPAALKSAFDAHEAVRQANKGHMYEVNIHAEPQDFLHYDKTLGEQSPQVQKALGYVDPAGIAAEIASRRASGDHATADWLQKQHDAMAVKSQMKLPEVYDLNNPQVIADLQAAGIPGIRYLDAGSRGGNPDAPGATHNHVIFDPNTLEIIRRFGIAGLVGGGAAATAAGGNQGQNQ